jgi:ribonuclease R
LDTQTECFDLDYATWVANLCTEKEVNVDDAAFAIQDRLKLRLIRAQQLEGKSPCYEGIIAKLVADGPLIYIAELGLFGLLPKDGLGSEKFFLHKKKGAFVGKQSGNEFACGDTVFVVTQKADIVKGRLLLRKAAYAV